MKNMYNKGVKDKNNEIKNEELQEKSIEEIFGEKPNSNNDDFDDLDGFSDKQKGSGKMIILRNFSKFFSYLGQIMAFLTIIILGLTYLNQALPFAFLPENFSTLLTSIKEYAVILTITVCGLSFACRRSLLIFIPFCILAICALACYSIVLFSI